MKNNQTFAEMAAGKSDLPGMVEPILNHIESIWVWPGGWTEHVAEAPVGALEFVLKIVDEGQRIQELESEIENYEEDDAEEQRRLGDLIKDLYEAVKEVCDEHEKQIYP